jgi:hypothetical protein
MIKKKKKGSFILLLAKQTSHPSLGNKLIIGGKRHEFFGVFNGSQNQTKPKQTNKNFHNSIR